MTATIFRDIYGYYDKPRGETATEQNMIPQELTPYQRLAKTFLPDEFGEMSNAVNSILEVSCMSMFIGGLCGGVMSSKTAYLEFFQNNQATAFKDHLEAKKRLQDKVTLAFGKGAWRLGWRVTLFSTSYVTFTTAVSTYRGKNGILEHVVGAGVAGSVYKLNGGPQAMLVGGIIGSALGLIAGSATLLLLKAAGLEISDVQANSMRWHQLRTGKAQEGLRKQYIEKESKEQQEHTEKVKGIASDLDALTREALLAATTATGEEHGKQ